MLPSPPLRAASAGRLLILLTLTGIAVLAGLLATRDRFAAIAAAPEALWADPRYAELRRAIHGLGDIGFATDITDLRFANHRLQAVQWACSPVALRLDFDLASVATRLERGFALVLDFASPEELDRRLALFETFTEERSLERRVRRLAPDLALVVTSGRRRG